MKSEYEIVEIDESDCNGEFAGFYATTSGIETDRWTWNNRGNGPELIGPEDTWGPFPTEAEAQEWIDQHTLVCCECGGGIDSAVDEGLPPISADKRGSLLCDACRHAEP